MNEEVRSIALVSQARKALTEAKTINEAKIIMDRATLAKVLAQKAKLGLEAQNEAAEVKIRAERLAGQLIQEGQEREEIATPKTNQHSDGNTMLLSDIGISKIQSSRWQQEANIPDEIFENHVIETKDDERFIK